MLNRYERYPLLLKYSMTYFRRIRMVGGACCSIFQPLVVHAVSFPPRLTLKFHTNTRSFGVPSQHMKQDTALQQKAPIATVAVAFHNLPQMHKKYGMIFQQYPHASHCSHHVISAKVGSQISCKTPDLGYSLIMGNMILCCTKRHPLLLKCSITFFRHMRSMGGASDCV